jgi:Rrf2 family protein
MRISRSAGYAIQALAAMASQGDNGRFVGSHITAGAEGLPDRFLLKLLGALVRAGILHSVKGPNGGYRLARPANKVTLLEIIEAVDGRLRGEVPRTGGKGTDLLEDRLRDICQQATDNQRKQLEKVRLSELTTKGGGSRR